MSGYKTEDGTDLDDIFLVIDNNKKINDEYLIEGKTGTGRYMSRADPSSANSQNDVGFITSGDQDLNELYVRRDEIVTKWFNIAGDNTSSGISKGANLKVGVTGEKNTTLYYGTVYRGLGGDVPSDFGETDQDWVGRGNNGGYGYCLLYTSDAADE